MTSALEDGTYRFLPGASRAEVVADAPGHKFKAGGAGLEGEVTVEGGRVTAAEARFPLAALDAGDFLANREMRKFLDLDRRPVARGTLLEPITMSERDGVVSGAGQVRVEIPGRTPLPIPVRFEGRPPEVRITLDASFSRFGYKPPKLLFIKVKDAFALTVSARVERT